MVVWPGEKDAQGDVIALSTGTRKKAVVSWGSASSPKYRKRTIFFSLFSRENGLKLCQVG